MVVGSSLEKRGFSDEVSSEVLLVSIDERGDCGGNHRLLSTLRPRQL